MGIYEPFRCKYLKGKVLAKYRLPGDNLGLIIEEGTGKKYSIELKTRPDRPNPANLYGLLEAPFKNKGQHLEQLIKAGDLIDLAVDYAQKNPLKTAYRLYSVTGPGGNPQDRDYNPWMAYQPKLRY